MTERNILPWGEMNEMTNNEHRLRVAAGRRGGSSGSLKNNRLWLTFLAVVTLVLALLWAGIRQALTTIPAAPQIAASNLIETNASGLNLQLAPDPKTGSNLRVAPLATATSESSATEPAVTSTPLPIYYSDLSQLKHIAIVSMECRQKQSSNPVKCDSAVQIYTQRLDEQFAVQLGASYLPMTDVLNNPIYSQIITPEDTNPITKKQEISEQLNVDGFLAVSITYYFNNDSGDITYYAYPSVRLYNLGKDEPVWEYAGTGVSAPLDVPYKMQLALGAKDVVLAGLSDEDISALMDIAAEKNDELANQAAVQLSTELARAIKVARGEQQASFFDVAKSGRWGVFFEWKAMGAAIALAIIFFILMIIVSLIFSGKWNTEGAGRLITLMLFFLSLYYLYEFLKAVF